MYSKKALEEKFNVSDNTVYKTLQVCGLGTKKQEYSEEEIANFFVPARTMLDAGKTYKEVKEYFHMKLQGTVAEPQEDEEFDAEGFAANQATDAGDAVSVAVAQTVADMVQDSVREVLPYVPALVVQTLNQELNSSEFKESFNRVRSQIKTNKGSGAAFLLQKMRGQNQPQLSGKEDPRLLEPSSESLQEPFES